MAETPAVLPLRPTSPGSPRVGTNAGDPGIRCGVLHMAAQASLGRAWGSMTMELPMSNQPQSALEPLDEEGFDRYQSVSDDLTLVDFWAAWCGPCLAMTPRLEVLARQYQGKVRFAKVNVDGSRRLAARFSIRSIPTLVLLRKGRLVSQLVGLHGSSDIADWLDDALDQGRRLLS